MVYFKKYGIQEEEIKQLKEKYNDGIIEFLTSEEEFVEKKVKYLQDKKMLILPILQNNIKIFLETMIPLKRKIEKMEKKGYSAKMIQMILVDEKLYNKQ